MSSQSHINRFRRDMYPLSREEQSVNRLAVLLEEGNLDSSTIVEDLVHSDSTNPFVEFLLHSTPVNSYSLVKPYYKIDSPVHDRIIRYILMLRGF